MTANRHILIHKLYDVVKEYSIEYKIPFRNALDIFYNSNLYVLVSTGVADMHCRSDGYLAEELQMEIDGGLPYGGQ
ncbi:MAG: DUF3791 domain-containing protein [Clostridiales bacterium]|jgi:hypothetical protein|nr:DUF3791 domain-containing protein [Clostridiales bacterium]